MAGLLGSLSIATSGLTAARTGLDATGHNIANINTPGYVRRRVDLGELAPSDTMQAGRGVEVLGVRALRDQYIDLRIGREQGGKAADQTMLDGLRAVEAMIGMPGDSLDARINSFFDSFSALASDVTSITARDSVVREAQALGEAFASLSARLTDAQAVHNRSIVDAVEELNDLARSVAKLNGRIVTGGVDVEALRDERTNALKRMAELAEINVIHRPDGAVDVTAAAGDDPSVEPPARHWSLAPTPTRLPSSRSRHLDSCQSTWPTSTSPRRWPAAASRRSSTCATSRSRRTARRSTNWPTTWPPR
jgi:flagellar hook-associated protein 1 FlgK